ncbi:MAG TPA: FkbM family methyltransferase [Pseudolabrys sp.]|nr:FkbM family methyltransferase [Pseudolabrys sp.]
MTALRSAAARVVQSVPDGVMTGALSVGLYGYGFLGRWALPQLQQQGVRVISCYDLNPALHEHRAGGLPVRAPTELPAARPDFVFITARHAVQPVSDLLSSLHVPHASYDAWYVARHFADFERVHDEHLTDERSREVLRAVLMAMLTGDASHCAAVYEPDQYFRLAPFRDVQSEIFVDAGAFDGDSTESFIDTHHGSFSHIYAFEPGPDQFAALRRRARRLTERWALDPCSITLINAGLGERDGSAAAASANGLPTSLALTSDSSADAIKVDVVSLDRYLNGRSVTFIKADVEGMEMALLNGARSTIQKHKPKLGICVYHFPSDIPQIANYIATLAPDYQFALRHHAPNLMETVLYCWPA